MNLKLLVFSISLFCIYQSASAQSINPTVTQDNIHKTICVRGYTKTIRPSVSYTNNLKYKELAAIGLSKSSAPLYELDHQIPLEVGGNPTDPTNLHIQLWNGPTGAHAKDAIENLYHTKVCNGNISLRDAQQVFIDWKY
jgi:hypothetical protein